MNAIKDEEGRRSIKGNQTCLQVQDPNACEVCGFWKLYSYVRTENDEAWINISLKWHRSDSYSSLNSKYLL